MSEAVLVYDRRTKAAHLVEHREFYNDCIGDVVRITRADVRLYDATGKPFEVRYEDNRGREDFSSTSTRTIKTEESMDMNEYEEHSYATPEDVVSERNHKEAQRLRREAAQLADRIKEHEAAIEQLQTQRNRLVAIADKYEVTAKTVLALPAGD